MFLWQYQAVTQRDLSSSNAHWKKSSQKISNNSKDRSSRPEVFCKKDVFRNFAKFTGKHLCQSLFFSKVAGLRPATLLKKRPWHRCFPVNFAKSLRTPFFTEHLRRTASIKKTFISESAFGKIFNFNFDIVWDFNKKFHDTPFLTITWHVQNSCFQHVYGFF